jgi:ADP-ribosylglycohydrolase
MNVQAALLRFEATGEPHCGSTDPMSAGNGCLMRLAPVPMAFSMNPVKAIELSAESARTTHGATAAVDTCRYLGALIVGVFRFGLSLSKVDVLWQDFTVGILIIAAVAIDQWIRKASS